MGHRQDMTDEQRLKWDSMQYKRKLEANRGSNYEYWTEKHEKMLKNGWQLYRFTEKARRQWVKIFEEFTTSSEHHAKKAVKELRSENNFARIVCGYQKSRQRIKMYSVIYINKNYENHLNNT